MLDRLSISPRAYRKITFATLASLVLIVFTGSAVRLTASGLGCPDWPQCETGEVAPPMDINAIIEFGNRILSGIVGAAAIATAALAYLRRPFRWHLALIGAILPVGVVGQIVLGALVVAHHLPPEMVMGHFIISMILIDAAFVVWWLSRYEPGERRSSGDRLGVWSVRALIPIGQLTILLGTIVTGAGPHPGDHDGDLVRRFDFKGGETLEWIVVRHGAMAVIFALSVLAVLLLLTVRRRADRRAAGTVGVLLGLVITQIGVGLTQWFTELPAGLVWVHVCLGTVIWVTVLWSVAQAGLLKPRSPTPRATAAG